MEILLLLVFMRGLMAALRGFVGFTCITELRG